jgi:hypothetical protein
MGSYPAAVARAASSTSMSGGCASEQRQQQQHGPDMWLSCAAKQLNQSSWGSCSCFVFNSACLLFLQVSAAVAAHVVVPGAVQQGLPL